MNFARNKTGLSCVTKIFPRPAKRSFEFTLCSSYSQTKPVEISFWVCSSGNKNFVRRISPARIDNHYTRKNA